MDLKSRAWDLLNVLHHWWYISLMYYSLLKEETPKPYLSSLQQCLLTQHAIPAKTPLGFRKNLSGNVLKCFPLSTPLLKTATVRCLLMHPLSEDPGTGTADRRAVKLKRKAFHDFWELAGSLILVSFRGRENPTTNTETTSSAPTGRFCQEMKVQDTMPRNQFGSFLTRAVWLDIVILVSPTKNSKLYSVL